MRPRAQIARIKNNQAMGPNLEHKENRQEAKYARLTCGQRKQIAKTGQGTMEAFEDVGSWAAHSVLELGLLS